MKLAFHLNCLEQGGAERVVSNLANQFVANGHEVYVFTEWQGEDEFALDSRVKRIHVGLRSSDEKRNRVTKFLLRLKYLNEAIKKEKPEILIAFAQKAIYRGLMATYGTDCPVCVCVRTDPVGHYDAFTDRLQIKCLFPKAAGFVFQTSIQRDFFNGYVENKSTVILNPVHQKYIDEPKSNKRQKIVVQSGRLVDFKNQPMLIEAFSMVHEKHSDYILRIIGPDSFDGTKEILEQKIKEYNLQDCVELPGASDHLEKDLKDAAVYAFSSDWEGLPNALIEAMALRLPVVATDCPCGGPAELIESYVNGILVPIKDAKAMADGICYMIDHPDEAERMADEAGKIVERTNSQAIYNQWAEYIETIRRK